MTILCMPLFTDALAVCNLVSIYHMPSFQPIDEAVLVDRRATNSRGGKGIGAKKFEAFWKVCQEILLPDSAIDERRHGDNVHASAANSISNLIK